MKVSINLVTGLLIEGQSAGDEATLLANAYGQGFVNVEVREVTEDEHRALILARDA